MNIVEIAADVIVLLWTMLITAYTMILNKKVDAIRETILKRIDKTSDELREREAKYDGLENCVGDLLGLRSDVADMGRELADSDRRTVNGMKQHKEALRELYEYAQKACEIRSDMLQKITDLERCAQAHEAWIAEQEEKQWKD